jgi:uncharacterized protein YabN with tetrapyrrole methylase and pyrophosphatase domain
LLTRHGDELKNNPVFGPEVRGDDIAAQRAALHLATKASRSSFDKDDPDTFKEQVEEAWREILKEVYRLASSDEIASSAPFARP